MKNFFFLLTFLVYVSGYVTEVHPHSNGELRDVQFTAKKVERHAGTGVTFINYEGTPLAEGVFSLNDNEDITSVACEYSNPAGGQFMERLRVSFSSADAAQAALGRWRTGSLLFGRDWQGCGAAEVAGHLASLDDKTSQWPHADANDELAQMLAGGQRSGNGAHSPLLSSSGRPPVDQDSDFFYKSVARVRLSPQDASVALVTVVSRDWYHMFEQATVELRHVPHTNVTEDHVDALMNGDEHLPRLDAGGSLFTPIPLGSGASSSRKRVKFPVKVGLNPKFNQKINYRDVYEGPAVEFQTIYSQLEKQNDLFDHVGNEGQSQSKYTDDFQAAADQVDCHDCYSIMAGELRMFISINRRLFIIPYLEQLKVRFSGDIEVNWNADGKLVAGDQDSELVQSSVFGVDHEFGGGKNGGFEYTSLPSQFGRARSGSFDIPFPPMRVSWLVDMAYRMSTEVHIPTRALVGARFQRHIEFGVEYRKSWPKGSRVRTYHEVNNNVRHLLPVSTSYLQPQRTSAVNSADDQTTVEEVRDGTRLVWHVELGPRIQLFLFKSKLRLVEMYFLPSISYESFPFRAPQPGSAPCSHPANYQWAVYFSVNYEIHFGGKRWDVLFGLIKLRLPRYSFPKPGKKRYLVKPKLLGYGCNVKPPCFANPLSPEEVVFGHDIPDQCLSDRDEIKNLLVRTAGDPDVGADDDAADNMPGTCDDVNSWYEQRLADYELRKQQQQSTGVVAQRPTELSLCSACNAIAGCGFCQSSARCVQGVVDRKPYRTSLNAPDSSVCLIADFKPDVCALVMGVSPKDSRAIGGITLNRARYLPDDFCQQPKSDCHTEFTQCTTKASQFTGIEKSQKMCDCFDEAYQCNEDYPCAGTTSSKAPLCKQCLRDQCRKIDADGDLSVRPDQACAGPCDYFQTECSQQCSAGCVWSNDASASGCIPDALSKQELNRELKARGIVPVSSTPEKLRRLRADQQSAFPGTWAQPGLTLPIHFSWDMPEHEQLKFSFAMRPVRVEAVVGDDGFQRENDPDSDYNLRDTLRIQYVDASGELNCEPYKCQAIQLTTDVNKKEDRAAFSITLQAGQKLSVRVTDQNRDVVVLGRLGDDFLGYEQGWPGWNSDDLANDGRQSPQERQFEVTQQQQTTGIHGFRLTKGQSQEFTVRHQRCPTNPYALAEPDPVTFYFAVYRDGRRGKAEFLLDAELLVDPTVDCGRRPETDSIEPWIFGMSNLPISAPVQQLQETAAQLNEVDLQSIGKRGAVQWQLPESMPTGRYELLIIPAPLDGVIPSDVLGDQVYATIPFHIGQRPDGWSEEPSLAQWGLELVRGPSDQSKPWNVVIRVSRGCSRPCGGGHLDWTYACSDGVTHLPLADADFKAVAGVALCTKPGPCLNQVRPEGFQSPECNVDPCDSVDIVVDPVAPVSVADGSPGGSSSAPITVSWSGGFEGAVGGSAAASSSYYQVYAATLQRSGAGDDDAESCDPSVPVATARADENSVTLTYGQLSQKLGVANVRLEATLFKVVPVVGNNGGADADGKPGYSNPILVSPLLGQQWSLVYYDDDGNQVVPALAKDPDSQSHSSITFFGRDDQQLQVSLGAPSLFADTVAPVFPKQVGLMSRQLEQLDFAKFVVTGGAGVRCHVWAPFHGPDGDLKEQLTDKDFWLAPKHLVTVSTGEQQQQQQSTSAETTGSLKMAQLHCRQIQVDDEQEWHCWFHAPPHRAGHDHSLFGNTFKCLNSLRGLLADDDGYLYAAGVLDDGQDLSSWAGWLGLGQGGTVALIISMALVVVLCMVGVLCCAFFILTKRRRRLASAAAAGGGASTRVRTHSHTRSRSATRRGTGTQMRRAVESVGSSGPNKRSRQGTRRISQDLSRLQNRSMQPFSNPSYF